MKISARAELAVRQSEIIMLCKSFRLIAVELAKTDPGRVEPALHAVMEMVVADLRAIAEKFPQGIARDHPLAVTARMFQDLIAETREDIAKAAKPH